jgi:hypothetical protein
MREILAPDAIAPSYLDREIKIIAMGRLIKGMANPRAMSGMLADRYCYEQVMTLGREAIRREVEIRAPMFAREIEHVA